MNSLYAVIASLPFLKWGETPPMTQSQFDNWVANILEPGILKDLHGIMDAGDNQAAAYPGHRIFSRWQRFDRQLRLALAIERQKRLGWLEDKIQAPTDPDTLYQARLALDQANPLEAERAIELLRWNFLEQAGTGHYFDITALVCWWLKLGILWRLERFRETEGQANFKRFHEGIAISIKEFYQKAGAI